MFEKRKFLNWMKGQGRMGGREKRKEGRKKRGILENLHMGPPASGRMAPTSERRTVLAAVAEAASVLVVSVHCVCFIAAK